VTTSKDAGPEAAAAEAFAVARAAGRRALDERAGKALLASFGVKVPKSVVVAAHADAAAVHAAAAALRCPLAVKVVSPDILHKSDAGGVRLGLSDAAQVEAAIAAMAALPAIAAAQVDGWLIEEMGAPGQEIVVGVSTDPQFGPLIMVGLGGIFVEVLADVAFRICPIDASDAHQMLDELKGAALLDGARGRTAVSRQAIVDVLLAIGGAGGLVSRHGAEISELDINPLLVGPAGALAVDARVILRQPGDTAPLASVAVPPAGAVTAAQDVPPAASIHARFAPLFMPQTVAVVGASTKGSALPNVYIRRIREFGYTGAIYPIHPSAAEIDGLPAYRSLADTPQPVDYAYIAIAAGQIAPMLAAANGRLKFAQVISSGFGEVEAGVALQGELVRAAHEGGVRVIGPNCLGTYSPRGQVTFTEIGPKQAGAVGIVSQSGGLGTDIIRRGSSRGLRFSGLVTVGNCADVVPSDLVEFFLADAHTRVVGLYIETARDARRLFELLHAARAAKPVVILKGGRTASGLAAAASHTGALAGDDRSWVALSRQCGCVLVDTLDQFIDTLQLFQALTPRPQTPTERVVLFGNGGGTSVLATDYFSRRGLEVRLFEPECLAALDALGLPPGTSLTNPVDCPVGTLQQEDGRVAGTVLDIIYRLGRPQALVMHLNMAAFAGRTRPEVLDNVVQAALNVQAAYPGQAHFMLVLRSDGDPALEQRKREFRARAFELGLPVFDEMSNAGDALAGLQFHERFRSRFSAAG
jgi:acyl-CoA synthetase (NDP forming)